MTVGPSTLGYRFLTGLVPHITYAAHIDDGAGALGMCPDLLPKVADMCLDQRLCFLRGTLVPMCFLDQLGVTYDAAAVSD